MRRSLLAKGLKKNRWFTLRDLCSRLIAGVNLGVRRRSNKTFTGAFTGEEAILWILADEKNPARAAPEALQLAQALLDYGFVQRMSAHRQLHDTHLRHTDVSAKKRFKNNATVCVGVASERNRARRRHILLRRKRARKRAVGGGPPEPPLRPARSRLPARDCP